MWFNLFQQKKEKEQKQYQFFKYRLYPTKRQEKIFLEWLETCRRLYNQSLNERIENWEQEKLLPKEFRYKLSFVDECIKLIEKRKKNYWLNRCHTVVLRDVLKRVKRAFDKYFNEQTGFPRHKKSKDYKSFTFDHIIRGHVGRIADNRVFLSKRIGMCKIRIHRDMPKEGKRKILTIKKDVNKWYAIFTIELLKEESIELVVRKPIGIDLGLLKLATLSDGTVISNERFNQNEEKILARENKNLSRKVIGSNNWKKQTIKIANRYQQIRYKKYDYFHKITNELVEKYDVFFLEDLPTKNLVKNHYLAKSISDACWGIFKEYLIYKAERKGKKVFTVNRYGTSIDCSNCGEKVEKSLAVRTHKCPRCKIVLDRDVNAAKNIEKRGLENYGHLLTTPRESEENACQRNLKRDSVKQEVGHYKSG